MVQSSMSDSKWLGTKDRNPKGRMTKRTNSKWPNNWKFEFEKAELLKVFFHVEYEHSSITYNQLKNFNFYSLSLDRFTRRSNPDHLDSGGLFSHSVFYSFIYSVFSNSHFLVIPSFRIRPFGSQPFVLIPIQSVLLSFVRILVQNLVHLPQSML